MRLNEDGLWSDSGFNQHLQNEETLDGQTQPGADEEGLLKNSTTRHWKRTVQPASFSKGTSAVDAEPKTDLD